MAVGTELAMISQQVLQVTKGLLEVAELKPGQILVIGCSTSEVQGKKIGSSGSEDVAKAILTAEADTTRARTVGLPPAAAARPLRALVTRQFGPVLK